MKTRIKHVLLATLVISGLSAQGQQEPIFTHYLHSPVSINPAIAGTTDCMNLDFLSRVQWIGIKGAPQTYGISAHTPYNQKKVGIGLSLMNDNAWPVNNTHLSGSYAYKVTVLDNLTLSMGIKAGFTYLHVPLTSLETVDEDDQAFSSNEKKIYPNIGFGFYLYSNDFFAGFSMPRLLQKTFDKKFNKNLNSPTYIMGGYNLSIDEQWMFTPSILAGAMIGVPVTCDVTMQFRYQDKFFFGTHYRIGDALGLFFDMRITSDLSLGYAFDFSLNKLSGVNSGTHELMLSYSLFPKWINNPTSRLKEKSGQKKRKWLF